MDATLDALESRALLLLLLVLFAKSLATVLHKKGLHWLSETAIYMLVGIFAAFLFQWRTLFGAELRSPTGEAEESGHLIRMSSKFFYMVLLPPIVFEGGYSLQRLLFFNNFTLIFALAWFGGLFSTVVTSLLLFLLGRLVVPSLTLTSVLVFGSLISSTDPVTVLALLPENLDKKLYMVIFGESALNDAVAVILYRFFSSLATGSGALTPLSFFYSAVQSAGVFFGSALAGLAVAAVYALLTKYLRAPGPERSVFESFAFVSHAYVGYLIGEFLGLTGIISVFFCGLGMSHYADANMDELSLVGTRVMLRVFSTFCEGFVFIYLGTGLLAFGRENTAYHAGFTAIAILAILIARSHVFIICSLSSLLKGPKIPWKHQVLVWWAGLRGAVAFALCVTLLEGNAFPLEVRRILFSTGVLVVSFTVLVFGGLTPVVLKLLKIDAPGAEAELDTGGGDGEMPGWVRILNTADDRFFKPLLSDPPKRPVILADPVVRRPHEVAYGGPMSAADLGPNLPTALGSRMSLAGAGTGKKEGYDDVPLTVRTAPIGRGEVVRTPAGSFTANPFRDPLPPIPAAQANGGSNGSLTLSSPSLSSLVLRASNSSLNGAGRRDIRDLRLPPAGQTQTMR
ncbi:Sodium/hydrogen exchanger family-domain-containing protein [Hyaloraphidium curvatum]|nr:Sodium/hydrogen exchanger family-domain-containing protein [Hyaloraphidium curvatum]